MTTLSNNDIRTVYADIPQLMNIGMVALSARALPVGGLSAGGLSAGGLPAGGLPALDGPMNADAGADANADTFRDAGDTPIDATDPVIIWTSPSYQALTGFCQDDTVGKGLLDIIAPDGPEGIFNLICTRILNNEPYRGRVQARLANGETANCWLRTLPRTDSDGEAFSLLALDFGTTANSDVHPTQVGQTDILNDDDRTQASTTDERFLRMAVSASNIGLWEWHVPSNNVRYSAEWFTMLGYDSDEFPPGFDTWNFLTNPEDTAAILEKADAAFVGSINSYTGIFRMRCKDGSWKWIKATGEVLERDGEGKALMIIGTHVDHSVEMEREETLKTALAKAEEGEKAKSQFLAVMSHEIRTPLNGILGMLDALLDGDLGREQLQHVEIAHRSANSLLRLLNDTLDVSKLESGNTELEMDTFNPADIVRDVTETFIPSATSKGLKVFTNVDSNVPQLVRGDSGKISQIILNLLGNALKFTNMGYVCTSLSFTPGEFKCKLTIAVTDTGPGIAKEAQANLFENFSQADSSISRRFGGTGLGLAICRGFAEVMGGTITLKSALDQGSTFTLTIPVDVVVNAENTVSADTVEHLDYRGQNIQVLVAEDNEINQLVITKSLKHIGLDPVFAHNGQVACKMAEEQTFDVILMDIQMPIMDGVTATKAIRAGKGACKNTPIIAITANAMAGDRERYLDAGMTDYVPKPINRQTLYKALKAVLRSVASAPRKQPNIQAIASSTATPATAGGQAATYAGQAVPDASRAATGPGLQMAASGNAPGDSPGDSPGNTDTGTGTGTAMADGVDDAAHNALSALIDEI